MGTAYTPGLKVLKNTTVEKDRRLPLKGNVLVSLGDEVTHDTVVARADCIPRPGRSQRNARRAAVYVDTLAGQM